MSLVWIKRNLAHIHFWGTAIIAGISLVAGLIFGIVFSKLVRIVDGEYSEWSDGFQAEN